MKRTAFSLAMVLCGALMGAAGAWALLRANPAWLGRMQPTAGIEMAVEEVPLGEYITLPVPKKLRVRPAVSKTIYLNREGARLVAGDDLASRNVSSLVRHAKLDAVDFPAFSGSHGRWRSIVKCLRKAFSRYDVQVVDQRPLDGSYIMAVFGGSAKLLGKRSGHSHATGLAPFSGRSISDAVVMIFTASMRNHLRNTCETAAMEIAHAYGLDHGYHCRDFMTYKRYCGTKRFVDKAVPCGEHKARTCKGGAKMQNSHKHLLELLGAAQR